MLHLPLRGIPEAPTVCLHRAHITKDSLFPGINEQIVTGIHENLQKPKEYQRFRYALGHNEIPYKTL